MKILIINWRSINDPLSGGAEVATFELAKRWVKNQGAEVTWLSPIYDYRVHTETIEGVKFEYLGRPLTRGLLSLILGFPIFYILIFFVYLTKYKGRTDTVIDEVHGFPYLTPLYVREKVIVYIHEVANEIWDLMYPFPINKIGHLLEGLLFSVYKKTDFIASRAASGDLIKIGIPREQIHQLDYGIVAPNIKSVPKKNKHLTLVFLNRLVKMKGPERAIDIFALVHKLDQESSLIIIGKGENHYINYLRNKVKDLGLTENIIFKGFVTQEEKFKILGRAHVLINSSFKEGWGLCNIEANRMGTPVVAFRVSGNKESVKEGVSGYLFETNDLQKIVAKIIDLKYDKELQIRAQEYSLKFNWDTISNKFYAQINK